MCLEKAMNAYLKRVKLRLLHDNVHAECDVILRPSLTSMKNPWNKNMLTMMSTYPEKKSIYQF